MVDRNQQQNDPITKMATNRNFHDGEYRIPVWQLNGMKLIRKFAAIIAAIIVVQFNLIFWWEKAIDSKKQKQGEIFAGANCGNKPGIATANSRGR